MDSSNPTSSTSAEAEMRKLAKTATMIALIAVVVIFAALLAALDALTLLDPFIRAVTTSDWGLLGTTLVALLHKLVPLLPTLFYLTAVLSALAILDRVSKGQYFTALNIRALGDMGGSMLWGAGWAILLVPVLSDWTGGSYGFRVDFRPEPLVIGTIGLCLLVLGRLLLRAQALEAEMEGIV